MSGPLPQPESTNPFPEQNREQAQRRALMGLVCRRMCWVPTLRGWLVFLTLSALLLIGVLMGTHPFLAVNDPRPGGILVVEGWVPDYIVEATIAEYERNEYQQLLVTGGPVETGSPLMNYVTIANVGASTIQKLRPDLPNVYPVPAPHVKKDRTYTSAVALKAWLHERGQLPAKLNLISGGSHSRRSRLLFQKAFGNDAEIGIVAMKERSYDPQRWWASSAGFRIVIGEAIAYIYARFFFRP